MIRNKIDVAEKMAIQALITSISEVFLHNEQKLLSDEEVNNIIFDSDGELKLEYFDEYRNHYDFFFEQLTNKNENTSN